MTSQTYGKLMQLTYLTPTIVTPARLTIAARSYTSATPAPLKSNISTTSSAVVSSTKDLIINSQRIIAGAVVSRQPLILRDLTPFEKEYFLYQKNLERDHAATFGAEFYFKKGSVAERRWKQQEAERLAAASGASSTSTGAKGSKSSKGAAEAVQDEITEEDRVAALEAKIQFNDRITDADRKNDVRSLERALARTLYLIVKKPREQHAWQFPQGGVRVCENLQEVTTVFFISYFLFSCRHRGYLVYCSGRELGIETNGIVANSFFHNFCFRPLVVSYRRSADRTWISGSSVVCQSVTTSTTSLRTLLPSPPTLLSRVPR